MDSDLDTLGPRARGWLRHIWDKATTVDDWSSAGEPLAWWDRDSTAPMCAFPRFDLAETAYALPLMCDVTPAWREAYTTIAEGLVDRHTTFWAAIDWLTLVGEDPNLDRYPPEWQIFTPESVRGAYEPPGWTGNGREPWGLQPDPIGADGNLFFRGFFNLVLSVHAYVSGSAKYREPFEVTGYMDRPFSWTHQDIASLISAQIAARPEGPHCENTKIWPFCVSGAGLGLKLYDAVHGGRLHAPFDGWTEFAERHYMGLDRRGDLEWFALYYDPILEEACTFPDHVAAYAALVITPYLLPQRPELATRLYEMACRKLGWSDPKARVNQLLPDPRFLGVALLMAHELGDATTEARLRDCAEREFEPRRFGAENDRFGWFLGFGEEFPRGQQSALLMLPEIGGPGAWSRAFDHPDLDKFVEPTVEGVDFPSLGIATARNDDSAGELVVRTYAATPSHTGRPTTWRVTQLPDPAAVRVTCNGEEFTRWRVVADDAIAIELPIGEDELRVRTGYVPGRSAPAEGARTGEDVPGVLPAAPSPRVGDRPARPPSAMATAAVSACRCC